MIKISHFGDFEQVIIKLLILLILNKNKTPLGETGYLGIFLRPLPCVTGTPPQLLRPVRVSTGSESTPTLSFLNA